MSICRQGSRWRKAVCDSLRRTKGKRLPLAIAGLGSVLLAADTPELSISKFVDANTVAVRVRNRTAMVRTGEQAGSWTLVAVLDGSQASQSRYAVFENFEAQDGHIVFVDEKGVQIDLPKSLEPTFEESSRLYRGHTLGEVMNSPRDLLGDEILAKAGDPDYEEVARCLAPIRNIKTYTFVGTHENIDKVGFVYGGRTPDFDPAPYDPEVAKVRAAGRVWDGVVGGWLPALRVVYPQTRGDWTEMIAFAPLKVENGNHRIQPVWYRVARIGNGKFKWARYIDSYHPFPPRTEYSTTVFYEDLAALHSGWQRALAPAMKIELPDKRLANMARYALVRDMITRVGDFPKYGAFDKDYAGSEHDGFPDTFNVDTTAMLEWGLVDLAGRYIDNYFGQFVRDDGSILYRGPETGQYGRMLTVVAEYANLGGDSSVLLRRRSRIDGVAKLLLYLREQALKLAAKDPRYGMIAGWSEADACLDPDPARYMQPYFSNSTEAARGFRDLGRVWEKVGRNTGSNELASWGRRLIRESQELERDIQTAMNRSMLTADGKKFPPSIAGVKEPFHIAVARDPLDPQFRSYRAYMEMLYSGNLTAEQVREIVQYRATHHDTILGVPTAYGFKTGELAGFLSYGHGFGLIQHDMAREALLELYSIMAHQYTRGTWTAPETRNIAPDHMAAPYCTPAELVVPLMTRWLLVFEDPQSETLWLAKAMPRKWLEDGKTVSVSAAPTRWGRIGFSTSSHLAQGSIAATITLPSSSFPAITKVRLRAPGEARMKSVTVNGKPSTEFDSTDETVTIPAGMSGTIRISITY